MHHDYCESPDCGAALAGKIKQICKNAQFAMIQKKMR